MLESGVSSSTNISDPRQAGYDATKEAAAKLSGKPNLLLVFSSIALQHPEVINGVRDYFPDVPMVGCSTAGEISSHGSHKQSVVVMALKSDQMHFTIGKGASVKDNSREAGKVLAQNIKDSAPEEVTCMLIFSDVLGANGTDITRGVLDVFGPSFTLVGGAAGDDLNFKDTHEYFNGEVLSGFTVGVGISGKYTKAFGAKHGWKKVGDDKIVTKAKGTTVYEIDHKPAFSIYQEYLGDTAEEMRKGVLTQEGLTYPLGMSTPGVEGLMVRTPLVVNEDNSIAFGAEVIEGSTVAIMMGSASNAMEAAEQVANNVMSEFRDNKPKAIFITDCIARKLLYGPEAAEEISKVLSITGNDIPTVGFYSYGQHAPIFGISDTEKCDINTCDPGFYEESIVVFALGE